MKKIFAIIVCTIFSFWLPGCDGTSPPEMTTWLETEATQPEESTLPIEETGPTVTVPFQAELVISAPEEWRKAFHELEILFKENQTNITLTFRFAEEKDRYEELRKGAPVDLFITDTTAAAKKVQTNIPVGATVIELGKNEFILIAGEEVKEKDFASFIDPEVTNIVVYGAEINSMKKMTDSILKNIRIESDKALETLSEEETQPVEETTDPEINAVKSRDQRSETEQQKNLTETGGEGVSRLANIDQISEEDMTGEESTEPTLSIEEKLVTLESAEAVIAYVKENTGAVGFIFRMDLPEDDLDLTIREIPEDWYEPKKYSMFVIRSGEQIEAAGIFMQFMERSLVQEKLKEYGVE